MMGVFIKKKSCLISLKTLFHEFKKPLIKFWVLINPLIKRYSTAYSYNCKQNFPSSYVEKIENIYIPYSYFPLRINSKYVKLHIKYCDCVKKVVICSYF